MLSYVSEPLHLILENGPTKKKKKNQKNERSVDFPTHIYLWRTYFVAAVAFSHKEFLEMQ